MKWLKRLYLRLAENTDFSEVFRIDLRSLAVVRILTATILLLDLITRLPDLVMFYGDAGVLPSSQLSTFWMGEWGWSPHLLFGGPTSWIAFLFLLQIVFALSLLFGFWTRVSSIVSWVLLVSLHNANPLILLGGDFLLRQTMFAGMFVPWGEVFSLDRIRARTNPSRISISSVWGAAFLIQIALMYYFASLYKSSIEWNVDGSAFYYILSIDQYVTPLGHFLLNFPGFLKFLTLAIVTFQHGVLFLLFIPICNRPIRFTTTLLLMLMHFCFGVGTHLGIFSWISMAALVAFIPDIFWNWLQIQLMRFGKNTHRLYQLIHIEIDKKSVRPKFSASHVSLAVFGVLYICYLFMWQAADFVPSLRDNSLWSAISVPAKLLRLDQRWNLFAPRPFTDDGWDIIEGHLSDGRRVDLFNHGVEVSFDKPRDVYALYGLSHRRQYTLELRKSFNEKYRTLYAEYLCRTWNTSHSGSEHLESLTHIFMLEKTTAPGEPQGSAVPSPLISWTCSSV